MHRRQNWFPSYRIFKIYIYIYKSYSRTNRIETFYLSSKLEHVGKNILSRRTNTPSLECAHYAVDDTIWKRKTRVLSWGDLEWRSPSGGGSWWLQNALKKKAIELKLMVASSIKIVQGEIADAMLKLYYFLIDKTQIALVIIALSFSFYVFIIFTINHSVSPHPTLIFGRIKHMIAILQLKKRGKKQKAVS